jgi:hypothetical protein
MYLVQSTTSRLFPTHGQYCSFPPSYIERIALMLHSISHYHQPICPAGSQCNHSIIMLPLLEPCTVFNRLWALLHVERLHAYFFRPYIAPPPNVLLFSFSPHSSTLCSTSSNPSCYHLVCSTTPDDPADNSRLLNALAQWVHVVRKSIHGWGAHLVG